jgi:hypothetical protein
MGGRGCQYRRGVCTTVHEGADRWWPSAGISPGHSTATCRTLLAYFIHHSDQAGRMPIASSGSHFFRPCRFFRSKPDTPVWDWICP